MSEEKQSFDTWILHLLEKTTQHFSKQQAYLTGGSVRNLLWHTACVDWDIVTTGDAPNLARRLANELGGYYAHLHDKASRVVCKQDGQEVVFDIAPLHGKTIEEDLHQRDFTINAMAVPLSSLTDYLTAGSSLPLIDPLHGAHDAEAHLLRAVNDNIFKFDTLRLLRAIRLMAHYSLHIESDTEKMLARDASLVTLAAPERIRAELYAIIQADGATERLRFMDRLGLFIALFPEFIPARGMLQPCLHHWDVLEHSLETVATLEQLACVLRQEPETLRHSPLETNNGDMTTIQALLHEAEEQGLFHFSALSEPAMKMAALLHDIGKPPTHTIDARGDIHFYHHPQVGATLAQQVMSRLYASTQDRRLAQQVTAHHMRPGQLSGDIVTPRAIRRYFVDLGPTGIYVALVSLADHLSMRGPEPLTAAWARHLATVRLLLTCYIRERTSIIPPRLLRPEELIRHFKLEPGPLIGQLLEQIAEAQTEGALNSKEDVLWFVQERLKQTDIQK